MNLSSSSMPRALTLIALGIWLLARGSAASADPDYSGVSDILHGRREVLRDDHLFIGMHVCSNEGCNLHNRGVDFRTAASAIVSNRTLYDYPGGPPDRLDALGMSVQILRMFDLPYDVVASTSSADYSGTSLSIYDPTPGAAPYPIAGNPNGGSFYMNSASGDFNQDGYADLVALSGGWQVGVGQYLPSFLSILTAKDPKTPSLGVVAGPLGSVPGKLAPVSRASALAVGDFNGDGQPEIAVTNSYVLYIFTIDPKTLAISLASSTNLPQTPIVDRSAVSLAAGHFGSTGHDQLALAYATDAQPAATAYVVTFDFGADLKPIQKATYDTGISGWYAPRDGTFGISGELLIRSGRFDWSSPYDQIALKVAPLAPDGSSGPKKQLGILTFDANLNITPHPFADIGNLTCSQELVAGNFDRIRANPTPPPATERDPNLQLATVASDCANNLRIAIYDVDPAKGFAVSASSTYPLPASAVGFGPLPPSMLGLGAGDTETPVGRSALLGAPVRITVESQSQPSVILAAPPMHVDFVSPSPLDPKAPPALLNLSAVPAAYFSQYQMEESAKDQSSDQNTTSWSRGVAEKIGEKVAVGSPKTNGFTQNFDFAAQQTWTGSTTNDNSSYTARTFNVAQQTGFGDQLWLAGSRFNLYIYPVIGQKACPADGTTEPDCPDSQKSQMYMQLSGPDQIYNATLAGPAVEWYQPVWEPGNVFSYPATMAQLAAANPSVSVLSGAPLTFYTDASVFTERTTWSSGAGQSQSASSTQTFKEDVAFSEAGMVSVAPGISIGGSFSISGSFNNATAALNTHQTTLGKSDGIGVQKPGSFATPGLYQYAVTPYKFSATS